MSHYQYDKEALFMTYKRWLLLIVINTIITLKLLISFVGYTSVVRTRQDFLSLLAIVALYATVCCPVFVRAQFSYKKNFI